MPSFSTLFNRYRRLAALANSEKNKSEYTDDRAVWVGIGVAVAVISGLCSEVITSQLEINALVAVVSSGVTIPFGRRLANYFWNKKIEEAAFAADKYLNRERLLEEELRREVARIRSLGLTEKQMAPLLIEAYRSNVEKRKTLVRNEHSVSMAERNPGGWNYLPSEIKKTQDEIKEEEALQVRMRALRDQERIAEEIRKLEGRK